MSNKKTNEILEEQRRARREFLKLKQMQSGEIAPLPRPSEVAYVPITASEKLSNFWFHYKIHVIGIIAAVVFLAIMIAQCATRVENDLEILYFTYTPVLDVRTNAMAEYFEEFATDLNGDGEVNISVINCGVSKDSKNMQYNNVIFTKVQSVISGNEKALLIITDNESIKYFDNINLEDGLFETEFYSFDDKFYSAVKIEGTNELPHNLGISLRRVSGTTLEKNKNIEKYYKASKELLNSLKK